LIRAATFVAFAAAATPAAAKDPVLGQPIDCTLGDTCFIQNYVDADGGPGAADFLCGPLSYDGHKGTDFALPSLAAMTRGVAVLAAAPGRVTALRDGEADVLPTDPPADTAGKDCGNGVVVDHGGGWQTQYCHMQRGSVNVQKGQHVAMGAVLGQVGLSGKTQFPHLHLTVRHDGAVVDPFNPDGITTCDDAQPAALWHDDIAYTAGGLISTGMATAIPDYADIKAGRVSGRVLPAKVSRLAVWAYMFGAQAGDILHLSMTTPQGDALISQDLTLERTQAQLFRASAIRVPAQGWARGDYLAQSRLIRDGVEIDRQETTVRVEN